MKARLAVAALVLVALVGCASGDPIETDDAGRKVFVDVPVPPGYGVDTVDERGDMIVYQAPLAQKIDVPDLAGFFEAELPKHGWKDVHADRERKLVSAHKPGFALFVFLGSKAGDAPPETRRIIDVDAYAAHSLTVLRRPAS
jgi:hypothetical protein